jgi:hypothetical protein
VMMIWWRFRWTNTTKQQEEEGEVCAWMQPSE